MRTGCLLVVYAAAAALNTPAHRKLALRAAEEGVVLLKNEAALPLNLSSPSLRIGVYSTAHDADQRKFLRMSGGDDRQRACL